MEMRKCKECGKLFQPKGREQYCSDIHYRPCPICGTPVIAKYLSDPARRCDKCKGSKGSANQVPKVQPMKPSSFTVSPMRIPGVRADIAQKVTEEVSTATQPVVNSIRPTVIDSSLFLSNVDGRTYEFVGKKPLLGFLPGHKYTLKVERDTAAYTATTSFDETEEREVVSPKGLNKIGLRFAGQLDFYHYFRQVESIAQ